jgi:hypothetical protein
MMLLSSQLMSVTLRCAFTLQQKDPFGAVNVIEILRRSSDGVHTPFYCLGEDGAYYFVKSRGAGPRAMAAEWMCAKLAVHFALPIPPVRQVVLPKELIANSLYANQYDIVDGVAFGSQEVRFVDMIRSPDVSEVDQHLKAKIALFDLWIRNIDRKTINPNLLIRRPREIWLIDHEKALVDDWDIQRNQDFARDHLFFQSVKKLMPTLVSQHNTLKQSALTRITQWHSELPSEWTTGSNTLKLSHLDFLKNPLL